MQDVRCSPLERTRECCFALSAFVAHTIFGSYKDAAQRGGLSGWFTTTHVDVAPH